MITEINRLSELYAELDRAGKQIFTKKGAGGGSDIVLFVVGSHDYEPEVMSPFSSSAPKRYSGTLRIYNEESIGSTPAEPPEEVDDEDGHGWDMAASHNHPVNYPPNATLYADPLLPGTVILAQRLSLKVCIFSSVMPRVGVQCSG